MTVAFQLRRVYWAVRRPLVIGTAGLVVDDQGRVLLVRQSYAGRKWVLPGGGLKRGETLRDCALRELREEAGIVARDPDAVELFSAYSNLQGGINDSIALYVVREFEQVRSRDIEIANKGFFAPDALPQPMSGSSRRRIEEFLGRRPISPHW